MSHWMQTYTGLKFDPINPTLDTICIEDIAHALANICRYGGHTVRFYSVAEHSIMVSQFCETYPLDGLLHDAAEAYIGDMIKPIKMFLSEINDTLFRGIEDDIYAVIAEKFGLQIPIPKEVKDIDFRALGTEREEAMSNHLNHKWYHIGEPLPAKIFFYNPELSEQMFLARYYDLI